MSRGRWRRMLGLTWLDDDDAIVPNAAKVQSPAPALEESTTGVSFEWPRDTNLTREQIEVATRETAAAPSPTPGAGRTVETTALHAPRPQQWQPGPTPVLGGVTGLVEDDGAWTKVSSVVPRVFGEGFTGAAALLDYAESREKMPAIEYGDWPTMPMRSLSNDNYDRVWIAQGDDVLAIGVGDTPQEAAINYAAAVSELLTGERYGDAFDTKRQIRAQQAAGRGECGDGHEGVEWETWAR